MNIKWILSYLLLACSILNAQTVNESINFNEAWLFNLDDNASYQSENFDDSQWRQLDLPHDWSIEGAYDAKNPMGGSAGYLPGGIAYYRKTIAVPSHWKGNTVNIAFDGIYMNSEVWINGEKLGDRPYGWVSFSYDVSSFVESCDSLTFAVRVDNSLQPSARWYTGSGIYANTWIHVMSPTHISRQGGVFITTDNEQVNITTSLYNDTDKKAKGLELVTRIVDADGNEVLSSTSEFKLDANGGTTQKHVLEVKGAKRWSIDNPYLYTAVSQLVQKGKVIDEVKTRFGVRDIEWIPATGMWIDGVNVKLQGVCNHQDAGPLGTAVPDKILRFRIQQLKDMGVNAIRTSHNPQTPQFYDMCDEIGMMVMDEIFDGWKKKAKNDYGAHSFNEWWKRDITSWLERDRNHPSIVIYSVGNETNGPVAEELVATCHEIDPTRPVTSGHSSDEYMDVLGLNGASEKVDYLANRSNTDRVIIGTENTHTWQVRGYYRTKTWYRDGYKKFVYAAPDLTDEEVFYDDFMYEKDRAQAKMIFNSSYDNAYVRLNSRGHIEQVRDIPHYAGGFRWTGYDYIGEASYVHGGWPFKAFMGGAIDLANFEKDLFYLYQSQWTNKPMVHILPHWTHPMIELGTEIPVWVYSNCDEVELFLNDKSLGKLKPGTTRHDMQCQWLVPWQEGKLTAKAYIDGKVIVEKTIQSASRPAQNELSIDGEALSISGKDIVQVRVSTQDSLGNFYPYGENRTYFKVIGPGRIRALGNGSPIDVETHYGVDNRTAFYGLTRAFIESTGEAGDINLVASAIIGERKQITSNMVSIDTKILNLRGASIHPEFNIYYTLDGTTPTVSSTQYRESFPVTLGTTVKAIVVLDGAIVSTMNERFAEDEGMVWNKKEDFTNPTDPNSEQAEAGVFKGAKVSSNGSDYRGNGFLNFGDSSNGSVEWYRENDGDSGKESLIIRYSCQVNKAEGKTVNVIINGKVIAADLLLPNTGSWGDKWSTVSVDIDIKRGANTIRIENTSKGGAFIDQITYGVSSK